MHPSDTSGPWPLLANMHCELPFPVDMADGLIWFIGLDFEGNGVSGFQVLDSECLVLSAGCSVWVLGFGVAERIIKIQSSNFETFHAYAFSPVTCPLTVRPGKLRLGNQAQQSQASGKNSHWQSAEL